MRGMSIQEQIAHVCRRHCVTEEMALDLIVREAARQDAIEREKDRQAKAKGAAIDGRCVSQLHNFDAEQWPSRFVAVPRAGERVRSLEGHDLEVASVTHLCMDDERPEIEVELVLLGYKLR